MPVLEAWKSTWIPTADRLPTEEARYLVFALTPRPIMPFIGIAYFYTESGEWAFSPEIPALAVTHWMPLPPPPAPPR